jgi:hypothetical protein
MSSTEYEYLSGTVKYFYHEKLTQWGKWSHVLYLDSESLQTALDLKKRGMKNEINKDDEDGYFINLHRPSEYKFKNKTQEMTPPIVLDTDGVTPFKGMVGNGTEVTDKVAIYPTKSGIGVRWESSRIDSLVPFDISRDYQKTDAKQASMKDAPKPRF